MKFRIACLVSLLVFAFTSSGFVCASRVEKMEADIAALQLQFSEVQKRLNNDQTQLTEMILRADKKLEEINNSQSLTNDQVSQRNIQLAQELEQSRNELAAMRGRLDIQQKSLDEMQSSMQTVMSSVTNTGGGSVILPSGQEDLYTFIEQQKIAQNTAAQIAGEAEFIKRYPNDPRIEPMLLSLIKNYNAQGADREVIPYATKYLQSFPKGKSRNEVIYCMGDSALKIHNCDLAKKSFAMLVAENYKDAEKRSREAAACK